MLTPLPLTDEAAVERRLTTLLTTNGPPHRRTLWLLLVGPDDCQLPVLIPMDDVPHRPEPEVLASLAQVCAELVPGGSVVFALERPGSDVIARDDAAWADAIHRACAAAGVRSRGVHLVTAAGVRCVRLDEVA